MAVRRHILWPFALTFRGRSPIYHLAVRLKIRGRSPIYHMAVRLKMRGRSPIYNLAVQYQKIHTGGERPIFGRSFSPVSCVPMICCRNLRSISYDNFKLACLALQKCGKIVKNRKFGIKEKLSGIEI